MPKVRTPAKQTAAARKAKSSARSKPSTKGRVEGDCLIPPRVPNEAINQFSFKRADAEAQRIAKYVEWQTEKDNEQVTFLEKVLTEHVLGMANNCWNVHTDQSQWWVIDGQFTNLYSQRLFPSLDYLLSFHLGLMLRMESERTGTKDPRLSDRLAGAFRKWEQAAQALDESSESEEVQAVGMRCRETLLTFIRSVSNPAMVPAGAEAPQTANFVKWSELVAGHLAYGHRNERIRSYLKALAKETWELVNWLTHAANASKIDGTMAIDATHAVLEAFGAALIRYERRMPERCRRCSSLRLQLVYMPELETDSAICQTCGFLMTPDNTPESPVAIPL
ncbi:MAG TPA: hypothetical protein VK638_40725 [Edaphobacter sp.]|nr:hypothetical protein [Edaphobacter sp.]